MERFVRTQRSKISGRPRVDLWPKYFAELQYDFTKVEFSPDKEWVIIQVPEGPKCDALAAKPDVEELPPPPPDPRQVQESVRAAIRAGR
jgi:hypothetical protein